MQHVGECRASELALLIRVNYLRCAILRQCFLKRIHEKTTSIVAECRFLTAFLTQITISLSFSNKIKLSQLSAFW